MALFYILYYHAKKEKFSIQLSPTSNKAEEVDIEVCTKGCNSLFPYDSFSYFGVRWDEMNANIECWCLASDAFDESMVGPQVKHVTYHDNHTFLRLLNVYIISVNKYQANIQNLSEL